MEAGIISEINCNQGCRWQSFLLWWRRSR